MKKKPKYILERELELLKDMTTKVAQKKREAIEAELEIRRQEDERFLRELDLMF